MNNWANRKAWPKALSGILVITILLTLFLPSLSTVAANNEAANSPGQEGYTDSIDEIEQVQPQETEIQNVDSNLSQEEGFQSVESDGTYETIENNETSSAQIDATETDSDTSMSDESDDLLEEESSEYRLAAARDLTNTDEMYLYTDVSFSVSGTQEQVIYSLDINKGREDLSRYDLGASFSGDTLGIASIEVYSVDINGNRSAALVDGGDYTYDPSSGIISFGAITDCYEVVYTLNLSGSVATVDMSDSSSAVTVEGVFVASLTNFDGSSDKVISETKTFQPISANSGNSVLNNSSILTGYTTQITGATEVKINFTWSLAEGLVDGNGDPISLEVFAGNYFIFKIDSDLIEINNAWEGILSSDFYTTQVGVFYLYEDGTVIFVFNRFAEVNNSIYGQFSVTSGYIGQDGEEVTLNVAVNGVTIVPKPEKDEYTIDKSGELKDNGDSITWRITVNPERVKLEDVVITDTYDSSWNFDGGITVYKVDKSGNKSLCTEYTSRLVGAKWTIELGNIEEEFLIELTAVTTGSSSENTRTYNNTAYSDAEGYEQLSILASVTRTYVAVTKSAISTTQNSSGTSTVNWRIIYNEYGETLDVNEIELTDTLSNPYWYKASGKPIDYMTYDALSNGDFTLKIGNTTLTEGVDYNLNMTGSGFTITFNDSSKVTNFTGYLSDTVTIEYSVTVHTGNMPDGAAGWYFSNRVDTDEGRYSSITNNTSSLKKTASNHDYTAQTVSWKITANQAGNTLENEYFIYDILPDGFTLTRDTLVVTGSGSGSIQVVDSYSEGISLGLTEFFVFSDTAVNKTIGSSGKVQYDAGRGFSLTYYNTANINTTQTFTIDFRTRYNYDPTELGRGDSDYVQKLTNTNVSILYHENWPGYYRATSSTTIPSWLSEGGIKSGTFIQGVTDETTGTYSKSQVQWTAYANIMNKDLEGSVFEDEMLNGQTSSTSGVDIATSEQTITLEDVKVYPYTITKKTNSYTIINTDLLTSYLKSKDYLSVADNTVKINFPTRTDYEDYVSYLIANGITTSEGEANLRFAVAMASTIEGSIAPYYPNTAKITFADGDEYSWDASVSVATSVNPLTKNGTVTSKNTVEYSVVLNKDLCVIGNLVISDSLMYSAEGLQLLYMGDDISTITGYDLRMYYANISVDASRNTVYTKGDEITTYGEGVNAYRLLYDPTAADPENQGFKVVFDEGFTLNGQAIIMEYTTYLRDDYFQYGSTITNTVSYTGRDNFNSDWQTAYRYTTADGSSTGEVLSFSLKKVDTEGNSLTGAQFKLYSQSKKYKVLDSYVDENGVLEFSGITTGTYYLVETPPDGYESRYDLLTNAMEIVVKANTKEDGTREAVIYSRIDGVLQVISEDGEFEVENENITGSLRLVKYQNDENKVNTEYTLAGAEFILYKLANDGTKLYYTKADANGVLLFEDDYENAIRLTTDENGVINQDGILAGDYYLLEISAPTGYEIISDAILISVSQGIYDLELYDDLTLIDISGVKTWIDDEDYEYVRPESITVKLYRNGADDPIETKSVTPDSEGKWSYVFEDLPMCDVNGVEFEYTVSEEPINGYTATVDGYDITNTLTTLDVSGTKTWSDTGNESQRPESITVNLYQNEELINTQIVKPDAEGDWLYSFESLPKYDKSGEEYVYTITEAEVEGYTTTINGYDIVNEYTLTDPTDPTDPTNPTESTNSTDSTKVPATESKKEETTTTSSTTTTTTATTTTVATGDDSTIMFYALLLLILSSGAIMAIIFIGRRERIDK